MTDHESTELGIVKVVQWTCSSRIILLIIRIIYCKTDSKQIMPYRAVPSEEMHNDLFQCHTPCVSMKAFRIQPTGWDMIKPRLCFITMERLQPTHWSRWVAEAIQGEASITLCTHHSLRFSSPDSFCLSRREELPSRGYSPNGILVHSVYSRLAYGDCISYLGRRTYLMLHC